MKLRFVIIEIIALVFAGILLGQQPAGMVSKNKYQTEQGRKDVHRWHRSHHIHHPHLHLRRHKHAG